MSWTRWVTAILCNGLGRYADAAAAGRQASQDVPEIFVSTFALPELIEAAARSGNTGLAVGAVDELAEATQAGGTDWGLDIEARCRALVSEGQAAEGLYADAIDRLGRTRLRPELARAHLLYGEWLRRENRRTGSRSPWSRLSGSRWLPDGEIISTTQVTASSELTAQIKRPSCSYHGTLSKTVIAARMRR